MTYPFWHRHRFRWANGIGFTLSSFYALWAIVFALGLAKGGIEDATLPFPAPYVIVGAVSLVASIVLLAILLFGYVFQGADVNQTTPRYLLFGWTCAGGIFFLSQTIALVRFGAVQFSLVPVWLSDLYWYFIPVGAVIFALLLWVNSEGHHYPWEHAEDDEDYAYDDEDEDDGYEP